MKAMILAAGLGTRLRPLTKTKPKALVEVNDIPLLEIVIHRLREHGFHDILLNIHHFGELIIEFLEQNHNVGLTIHISDERDLLRDTGGGLKHASWFFDDGQPFLVHNVDILSDVNLSAMYQTHCASDALATLAVREQREARTLLFDHEDRLCGWQNTHTGEQKIARETEMTVALSFSGIHVISPALFDMMPEQPVFSIIDVYLQAAHTHSIKAFRHDHTLWADVGHYEQLLTAGHLVQKLI